MRRLRFVPSREQTIDDSHPTFRCDHEVRPTIDGPHHTVGIGGCLESPHHGGADSDDASTLTVGFVHPVGGGDWNTKAFRVGQLGRFERRHAGVQHERRHADTLGNEPCDHLRREWSTRARHLRAARFRGVDVLIRGDRPRMIDVAVADGLAVNREPGEHGLRQMELSHPQATAVEVRSVERDHGIGAAPHP